jgi:hypothetical protein
MAGDGGSNFHKKNFGQVADALVSGEVSGSVTAKNLPDVEVKLAWLQAATDNAGKVTICTSSGATKPDGTTDTTSGIQLAAGEWAPPLPIANLKQLWIICDNAGDDLLYLAEQ